ncbi:hypothetical protein [Micromonospora sp. NPDC049282]|uniref:hypothetical protein n=1 Tax=Micromonospora sp. NPDC049282 TaxID=3364269 RepID=UPI003717D2E7
MLQRWIGDGGIALAVLVAAEAAIATGSEDRLGRPGLVRVPARSGHGGTAAPAERATGPHRLPELLAAVRAAGSCLPVQLNSELPGKQLPAALDEVAYRIVQESLTTSCVVVGGERDGSGNILPPGCLLSR